MLQLTTQNAGDFKTLANHLKELADELKSHQDGSVSADLKSRFEKMDACVLDLVTSEIAFITFCSYFTGDLSLSQKLSKALHPGGGSPVFLLPKMILRSFRELCRRSTNPSRHSL
jgi:hypothetical protein